MDDEADGLSNLCTDLVSLRRLEPGLIHLFHHKLPSNWISVRELFDRAGQSDRVIKEQLAAAWLPAPHDPDYAIVVFYDSETRWSLTAEYNIARLRSRQAQSQVAAAG